MPTQRQSSRQTVPHVQEDFLETLGRKIEEKAESLASKLTQAAARARNQEDIRIAVERFLQTLSDELNVTIEGEHEYTLVSGHVDSVYGSVFIEYKNPADPSSQLGENLSWSGTAKVVEQIKGRFRDVVRETGPRGKWLLGVGCDGGYFVFCRFIEGQITVEEPVSVSRWSARRFLWALFNLGTKGWALTADSLAREFGHESALAREGVRAFFRSLRSHLHERRVETFFHQWKILFGEVCGYDMDNPKSKLGELADAYSLHEAAPAETLFALHTYYALLMKLLAAHVATSFQRIAASPISDIDRASPGVVLERIRELEDEGGVFVHLGITNFLEGDLFTWYLTAWTDEIARTVRDVVSRLAQYNPATLRDNPAEARDLLKHLYHQLFPRSVRHDLGEYYTPDWLAELVLDRVGYDGNPDTRVLDPACGSGTFLVLAIERVRRWLEKSFERTPYSQAEVARRILQNLIGFDLNPLAVLAARTNYLIQLLDLFGMPGRVEIPVYLCDSIVTPVEYAEKYPDLIERGETACPPVQVPTVAKMFVVPREVTEDRTILADYARLLAECARAGSGFTAEDFIRRCRQEMPMSPSVEDQHRALFADIRALDGERRNGVWARFIKNAFAPVFLRSEPVDIIVGNPPWVNWENLPNDYRSAMIPVWERYGLFSLSGSEGRLGGGKKDLSMLLVYVAADHYLRSGGKLGFVITQTVFKTKGAGDGFRRFEFGEGRATTRLQVQEVADLSDFQPFEGATNRTAVFICEKGKRRTGYPTPYTVWRKRAGKSVRPTMPLEAVKLATSRSRFAAIPVNPESDTSPWLTAPKAVLSGLRKVMGKSGYIGSAGCCTWLNGCFWIRILKRLPRGELLIENLYDVGKIKLPRVTMAIEPDLVYPLLRGRDVQRWQATTSSHIILAQNPKTRQGFPEDEMRACWPMTYSYLKKFETRLRARSGYRKYFKQTDPFYSMYDVGPYTLARWKVVWPEVGKVVESAVGGRERMDGTKPVLPDHTLIFIPCKTEAEASYVCALLNCSPAQLLVLGYVVLHPSPHVLQHVAIPQFDRESPLHKRLAELGDRCHDVVLSDRPALAEAQEEIDQLATQIWRITPTELRAIHSALRDMQTRPE